MTYIPTPLWPNPPDDDDNGAGRRYGRALKRWRERYELGEVCAEEMCFNPPSTFSEDCFRHRHGTSRIG